MKRKKQVFALLLSGLLAVGSISESVPMPVFAVEQAEEGVPQVSETDVFSEEATDSSETEESLEVDEGSQAEESLEAEDESQAQNSNEAKNDDPRAENRDEEESDEAGEEATDETTSDNSTQETESEDTDTESVEDNKEATEANEADPITQDAVKKEKSKSIDKLKKDAKKKASIPTVSNVQARIYYLDPTIAAYVKKRANGCCQLCGQKAPFDDQNGDPYLECHHIDWLSKGGMDSAENCVALCPNCHRRMHILNDPADINTLKTKIK